MALFATRRRVSIRTPIMVAVRVQLLAFFGVVVLADAWGEPKKSVYHRQSGAHKEQSLTTFDGEPIQLVLLNVLFRHGERTPDREEMELYPEDPNIDNTFEPYGLKALTNAGKAREYQIGVFLRNRYKNFLNKLYLPDEIFVRTTDYDRTKMSALACLAGLYPPDKSQQWNKKLQWQPIPYHTLPFETDDMMYYYTCPRFLEARLEALYGPEFQRKVAPYKSLFEDVSYHVGRNLTTPEEIFYIDNLFQAESNYDIPMPEWAENVIDGIREVTVLEYELQFATTELKKVAGGTLLKKMITDMKKKINGTLSPAGRKLFLYSAHENNVAAILACSGVFEPHQPPYGSTFILELLQKRISNKYGVRILYVKDVYDEPEVLTIPECGKFCPIDRFIQLTRHTVTDTLKQDCLKRNS